MRLLSNSEVAKVAGGSDDEKRLESVMRHIKGGAWYGFAATILAVLALPHMEAFGQNPAAEARSLLVGAATPELISDNALYTAAAHRMSACSNGVDDPFCDPADGVDMVKAAQLAQEFLDFARENAEKRFLEFCDAQRARRVPYRNALEFGQEYEAFMNRTNAENTQFFIMNGTVLLGPAGIARVDQWARINVLPNLTESRFDYAKLFESSTVQPEQLMEEMCTTVAIHNETLRALEDAGQ